MTAPPCRDCPKEVRAVCWCLTELDQNNKPQRTTALGNQSPSSIKGSYLMPTVPRDTFVAHIWPE